MLKYKVITEGCAPERMREEDAGYDFRSAEDAIILPGRSAVIRLGVAVGIDTGKYGLLLHRSSLAFKKEATISTGVIDSNFVQELKCKVFNHDMYYPMRIKKGDRIAQMIIHKYEREELEEVDDLGTGKGGFGSSGVR